MTDAEKRATEATAQRFFEESLALRQECPSLAEELLAGLDDDDEDDGY